MRGRLRFARTPAGATGLAIAGFVILVALLGPFFAPHLPAEPIGLPGEGPSVAAPLGTDFLGRDVLSRVLWGGRSVLALAGLATLLAYAGGGVIGLVAGYVRRLESVLMWAVDMLRAFPPLLLLLLLVTGAGTSKAILVIGVALVQVAPVARLVHTATLEASVRGYVEAAVARGEGAAAVLRREILPNILSPVLADAGLRFTFSILLVAAVNFLGLGLQPPDADWALMISENRVIVSLNPFSVFVPAALIAALTVGVNLVGDSITGSLGRSRPAGPAA